LDLRARPKSLLSDQNRGICRETAAALAGLGATVIMAVRNTQMGEAVAAEIR